MFFYEIEVVLIVKYTVKTVRYFMWVPCLPKIKYIIEFPQEKTWKYKNINDIERKVVREESSDKRTIRQNRKQLKIVILNCFSFLSMITLNVNELNP